ncbi:MAG: hypothetical protein OSJ61_16835 [Lachnospiraceae bacterium]|nr:hypothetical protein [Lachnospiraceae bacterium]
MRKFIKNDILESFQTMYEAHDELKNFIEKKDFGRMKIILEDLQNAAVQIGTAIEKSEGEGFVSVKHLEEYCEAVYEVSQGAGDDSNGNKARKVLNKKLIRAENSVKNDVRVKTEVVFISYKASMWDSLESVWRSVSIDPDCDVYVIAVPYYDLNPDRSFGQLHYEGDEYPDDVPVMHYEAYDLAVRKPDVIYFHNPYDDWNLVTSVHPAFYSVNLKKYTEMLIYIPYFVLDEIEPDNQAEIEKIKHYIWLPGVINADKVIVQSEAMKQIYVNEYLKAARANGLTGNHLDRNYLERKFLGLGSPKIDKILRTKKEDLDIPEEWLKVIRKPNGSRKKIVFYNTGISALLNCNEKWIEKIADVLKIFRENKDEVALLWRPHPLIENAMKSMRPEILQRYTQIKNQYISEGWGIHDDTADVGRAVILSDAYYGDGSSVVQLYRHTGKPIMTQNVDAAGKPNAVMFDAVFIDDEYWFVSVKDNILYKMDLSTYKVQYIHWLSHSSETDLRLAYTKLFHYKNKIILIPCLSKYIAVYDMRVNKVKHVESGLPARRDGDYFNGGVALGEILFLIPCRYNRIVAFNMETEKVEENKCIELSTDERKYEATFSVGGVVQEDENVIFTGFSTNKIYKVNLVTKEIALSNYDYSLSGIVGTKEHYWAFPTKGNQIIKLDKKGQVERIIKEFPQNYVCGEWSFHYQQDMGDEIVLLPRLANKLLCIDKLTDEIHEIDIDVGNYDKENYWDKYSRFAVSVNWKEKRMFVEAKTGIWNVFNETYESLEKIEPKLEINEKNFEEIYRCKFPFFYETEGAFINLNNYIKYAVMD